MSKTSGDESWRLVFRSFSMAVVLKNAHNSSWGKETLQNHSENIWDMQFLSLVFELQTGTRSRAYFIYYYHINPLVPGMTGEFA